MNRKIAGANLEQQTPSTIRFGDQILTVEDLPNRAGIRWAVGDPEGVRSSTWRVWGDKKGDTYLAVRALGGVIKASFHRDRRCHVGFTSEYSNTAAARFGASRLWEKWTLAEGPVVRAAQVVIPSDELAPFEAKEASQMRWLPRPPPGHAVVVSIFIAEPGRSFLAASETGGEMLGFMVCPTRFTWVVHKTQRIDDATVAAFNDARRRGLAAMSTDELYHTQPGLRMIMWGGGPAPADLYFFELGTEQRN